MTLYRYWGAMEIPVEDRITVRADRSYSRTGAFDGFRLVVRRGGIIVEHTKIGPSVEDVEKERKRLRQKWLAKYDKTA